MLPIATSSGLHSSLHHDMIINHDDSKAVSAVIVPCAMPSRATQGQLREAEAKRVSRRLVEELARSQASIPATPMGRLSGPVRFGAVTAPGWVPYPSSHSGTLLTLWLFRAHASMVLSFYSLPIY